TFASPLAAPASTYCTLTSPTEAVCATDLTVGTTRFALPVTVPAATTPGSTITGGCIDAHVNSPCDVGETAIADVTLGKPFSAQAQMSLAPATVVPGQTGTANVVLNADRPLANLIARIPLGSLPTGLRVIGAAGPSGS